MPNVVKYWNGSSWKGTEDFGNTKMWDGSSWRMVEVKYAGGSGSGSWNIPYNAVDSQVVSGGYTLDYGSEYLPSYYTTGYSSGVLGSIQDGTSNIYSGAQIVDLYFISGPYSPYLYFTVSGNRSNTGWTTMYGGGYTFNRADATYAYNSSLNKTEWSWQTNNDPFNATSATVTFVFV